MKFCKYCGTQLQDGQVCSCPSAQQAAAAAQPQQPVYQQPVYQQPVQPQYQQPVYQQPVQPAPAAAPTMAPTKPEGPNMFKNLVDVLLDTLKSPQKGCARLVADKARLPMLGMILGTHALLLMFVIWRFFGMIVGGTGAAEYIEYPFFSLLLTGILLAGIFAGLYGVTLFLYSKISKQGNVGILDAIVAATGYTIWPTGILLVGLLMSFLGDFGAFMYALCIILSVWVWVITTADGVREIAGVNTGDGSAKMGIVIGIRLSVFAISMWLMITLMGWCVEGITIMGHSIGDISSLLNSIF